MLRRAARGLIGPLYLGAFILGATVSCARSEHPLSNPEEGFVDRYLLGSWYEVWVNRDGTIDTPLDSVYEITIGHDGNLRILDRQRRGVIDISSGISARLGADKFLSLRHEECLGCEDSAATATRYERCPYLILQYATYVPKDLTTELTHLNYAGAVVTEFESWMNRMRGQLLFYRVLLDDPVNQAIARSEIQGDVSDLYDGVDACIRSTGNALRSFAVESTRDDSAFTEWTILMRTPLQRETLGKIAIDTPRQALITELLEDGCRGPETIIREYADQIVTLGYAESTGDDRVKRFELEDGRLAEINYAPAGLASPFAHAAQQLTRRSPLENGQFSSHTWYSTNDSGRESHYLPLLDCIEGFEEDKSQPSRLKEATAMLTACMRDKGWRLAKSTGTRAPVCRGIKP